MPKRRSHGTGSITEEKRAGGRVVWVGAVRVRGRQHQRVLGDRRKTGSADGMTRAQAERALREKRREIEAEVAQEVKEHGGEDTVAAVGEAYCRDAETDKCRPQTVQDYRIILRLHLVPFFEGRRLREIEVEDIEDFKRHQINEKGLAPSTVANHLNLLHGSFKLGMRKGCVDGNPVAAAKKVKATPPNGDLRFLAVEEVEALIRAVTDDEFGRTDAAIYVTAAMTGLRQGELLALRWKDVDWNAGLIRVRQSYSRGILGKPKSRRSERAVPMADRVAAALDQQFKASRYQGDDDLVFCHPHSGDHYVASTLLTRFKRALDRAGVKEVRFHDLRHTFATRMAAAGTPLRTLQAFMGHADIQTTMIYADYAPDPTGGRKWAEKAFMPAESEALTAVLDG